MFLPGAWASPDTVDRGVLVRACWDAFAHGSAFPFEAGRSRHRLPGVPLHGRAAALRPPCDFVTCLLRRGKVAGSRAGLSAVMLGGGAAILGPLAPPGQRVGGGGELETAT
ncbi:hypothetical protein NDU88_003150 [Pleurodeles waltl]|uniref:Uncharacterized protein n=1 Tax=Pleurodeles waltl TaxID=8319 RepID=A0AAV7V0Y6_PLEWA|nr:hypothetical protein NDU88_003150 [Pleurodeles waltl]